MSKEWKDVYVRLNNLDAVVLVNGEELVKTMKKAAKLEQAVNELQRFVLLGYPWVKRILHPIQPPADVKVDYVRVTGLQSRIAIGNNPPAEQDEEDLDQIANDSAIRNFDEQHRLAEQDKCKSCGVKSPYHTLDCPLLPDPSKDVCKTCGGDGQIPFDEDAIGYRDCPDCGGERKELK